MSHKSKPILGQWINNKLYLSDEEKRIIVDDYLSGSETKRAVFARYTGYKTENGNIAMWLRNFGLEDKWGKGPTFKPMPKDEKQKKEAVSDDFESLQLKKRIADLEAQLKAAEMKAIAFSTMVDIAEKELNISIRKKYNTKPSK